MHPDKLTRHSQYLSWLLRHGAIEVGLPMDAAGWAPVAEVRRLARLSEAALEEVISQNTKSRLQRDGDRIRASQGHSLEGTPVTLEALEKSWLPWSGTESIWHGTRTELVESILRKGLLAQARTHVHLAESVDSKVGKRAGVGVLLELSPARIRSAGQPIFISDNGVILVRHVPAESIVALHPCSRRARQVLPRLQSLLSPPRQ
jgi:putative RNA 2'-phosphotransferase